MKHKLKVAPNEYWPISERLYNNLKSLEDKRINKMIEFVSINNAWAFEPKQEISDNLYKRKLPVCDIKIYEPIAESLPELTYEKITICPHCGSECRTTCGQC